MAQSLIRGRSMPSAAGPCLLDGAGTMQGRAGEASAAESSEKVGFVARRHDRALSIIERCIGEQNVATLVDDFMDIVVSFGFHSGAAGGWTGMGRTRAYRFYFNTWPEDWLALYNARQVFFDDPLILEAQRRMAPFLWRDLEKHRGLKEIGTELLSLAYGFGWADGLVVPVHGPAGYQGVISLGAMAPLALTGTDLSVLWVMALAIHARCRETAGMGMASSAAPTLTKRETQCMRWVAAGKTDWEIGLLLAISPNTVHFHVERVKRRLATTSRTEAVALLVLHGAL